jgi:hypothetical protein
MDKVYKPVILSVVHHLLNPVDSISYLFIRCLLRCDSGRRKFFSHGEPRLPGYKNPVRTSQETHYVSTTESIQLMLCKI